MRNIKRLLGLLLAAALLAGCLGAAAEVELSLPGALRVIGEEAFAGLAGGARVILPDGVEEIQSRAFADSDIGEINLPGSLKYDKIAADAFDGATVAVMTAEEGTEAYAWAVDHGYIGEYTPMTLEIGCDVSAARVGDAAQWTAAVSGGAGSYRYAFELYRDGELVMSSDYAAADQFSHTFDAPGSYAVTCHVKDARARISATSGALTVLPKALSAAITCNLEEAVHGDQARWTVEAEGGTGAYTYYYEFYRNERCIFKSQPAETENFLEYIFPNLGHDYYAYVDCWVSDGESTVQISSDPIRVDYAETPALSIVGLEVKSEQLMSTETQTWTVTAQGGTPTYRYKFELKQGDKVLKTQDFAKSDTFEYTFFQAGDYTLTVWVKDGSGAVAASQPQAFTVTPNANKLVAAVRIYVDIDSSGKIIEDNSKTGHYELQIISNGVSALEFDDKTYDRPVFSFGSKGTLVFDGLDDAVTRTSARLYTFTFTADASKVQKLLNDELPDKYIKVSTEKKNELGYLYTSRKTYSITTTNCFTAVAAWCKLLGYGTLSSIASSAGSYTDYLAWQMYNKYGEYWEYVGTY